MHKRRYGFKLKIGQYVSFPTYDHWWVTPLAILWAFAGIAKGYAHVV